MADNQHEMDDLNIQYDENNAGITHGLTELTRIDRIIKEVCTKHEQTVPPREYTEERKRLLEQYIQLPNDQEFSPEDQNRFEDRPGQILVTFYTYGLRPDEIPDEEDEDEDGSSSEETHRRERRRKRRSKSPEPQDNQSALAEQDRPTYFAIPLQYLYSSLGGSGTPLVMDVKKIPLESEGNARIRIIEFPAHYYAADFLEAMKDRESDSEQIRKRRKQISMDKLITNRKASINQVKTSKVKGNPSKFLTGVSYYPNRPKRVVSHNVRGCFLPGTVLFVAIPYIGLEPASSARYRMKSPPGENALALGEALTAYHLVDNLASSYISSLGLPEYHFRKLKGNAKVEQTEFSDDDDDDKKEVLVVHQVWFMVLDDGNIATFRSANDVQSPHVPLFPQHHPSVGAYHALVNMIDNILPSWEVAIPEKFAEKISGIEYSIASSESLGDSYMPMMLDLKTMKKELSVMKKIVDKQIEILRNLKEFRLEIHQEQFRNMRKTIDKVIDGRKAFRETIQDMQQQLEGVQCEVVQTRMVETEKKQEMMADRQTRAQETLVLKQEAAEQALSEQNKQAEQTKNLQQGISMKATVFTFVTTVFLPLSFLTSYFGMNLQEIKDGPRNHDGKDWDQSMFWELAFGVTLAIILLSYSMGFIVRKWREYPLKWWRGVGKNMASTSQPSTGPYILPGGQSAPVELGLNLHPSIEEGSMGSDQSSGRGSTSKEEDLEAGPIAHGPSGMLD